MPDRDSSEQVVLKLSKQLLSSVNLLNHKIQCIYCTLNGMEVAVCSGKSSTLVLDYLIIHDLFLVATWTWDKIILYFLFNLTRYSFLI
jgi:hypothetical protein